MKNFRFTYIALAILILASFSPKIGILNANNLFAAPMSQKYQHFLVYSDNETELEYPAMILNEQEATYFAFIYLTMPVEGDPPKTSPGPVPIYPADSSTGCSVKNIYFSWTPIEKTTKYLLALFVWKKGIVTFEEINSTNYVYNGILEYDTDYYWLVMALEPRKSEFSVYFKFHTEAAPAAPPPQSETALQPNPLPSTMIVIIITTLLAVVGLIAWLLVARKRTK